MTQKKNNSDIAKMKSNFRATVGWKRFREHLYKERKIDAVTLKKLTKKTWNLHHCDLNESHYKDISNEDNFVCLNVQTHDIVHWLYDHVKKDPDIWRRLKCVIDKMIELNQTPEETEGHDKGQDS